VATPSHRKKLTLRPAVLALPVNLQHWSQRQLHQRFTNDNRVSSSVPDTPAGLFDWRVLVDLRERSCLIGSNRGDSGTIRAENVCVTAFNTIVSDHPIYLASASLFSACSVVDFLSSTFVVVLGLLFPLLHSFLYPRVWCLQIHFAAVHHQTGVIFTFNLFVNITFFAFFLSFVFRLLFSLFQTSASTSCRPLLV
jgi:hypothetical protein